MNKFYHSDVHEQDEPPLNYEELMDNFWVRMKQGAIILLAIVVGMLLWNSAAQAQTVPATATVTWTLPTTSVGGLPLTGNLALTELRLYVSTAPIADTPTGLTPIIVAPGLTEFEYGAPVSNGSRLYFRLAACNGPANARECGALSNQDDKLIEIDTTPGVPVIVTVEIQVGA